MRYQGLQAVVARWLKQLGGVIEDFSVTPHRRRTR